MPLGTARLNTLARTVSTVPTRDAVTVTAISGAQVSTAQKKFGTGAWYGDGGDALLVTEDFDFDAVNWTIEMFVRPTVLDGAKHLFDIREVGNTSVTHVAGILGVSGNYYMAWYDGGAWRYAGSTLSTNTWYHMAWVKTSGTTVDLYLDGTNIATEAVSASENDSGYVIGARYSNYNNGFKGYIDEVRLSTTERYSSGFTPTTSAFVNDENTALLLHMDGTNGSTDFPDDNGT